MSGRKRLQSEDKAVSPVIGVILMVAITVILAAVIGTFVMDLGSNVQANPQAGISFADTAGNDIEVTLTDEGNLDSPSDITVQSEGCTGDTGDFSNLGETKVLECSSGDKIVVIGDLNGNEAVVAEHTYNG